MNGASFNGVSGHYICDIDVTEYQKIYFIGYVKSLKDAGNYRILFNNINYGTWSGTEITEYSLTNITNMKIEIYSSNGNSNPIAQLNILFILSSSTEITDLNT